MAHEWVILANLFLLLIGFALLSRHFEKSQVPDVMPAILPDDWKGGFAPARHRRSCCRASSTTSPRR